MTDVLTRQEAISDYIDRILAEAPAGEETASVRLHRDLWKAVRDALGGGAELQARYDRLLIAFHDATRRPLGVTPDSGAGFYDQRMAEEAEARRPRIGTPAEIAERPEIRAAEAMRKACWRIARDDAGELHSADSVAAAERIMAGIQALAARPGIATTGGSA